MMRIFVTGGAGYIGSHTCLALLQQGHTVTVIDNLSNSSPTALERVQAYTGKPLRFCQGDVRDTALVERLLREEQPDCVIHFAGLKAVGESVDKPWEYYDNNLNSTLSLARAMARTGVKRIIFSSSAAVYRAGSEMPLRETSPIGGCTNPYAWTKFMSEQILSDMAHADPEWSVCLLRYFNPVGAHPSGVIGEDPRGIPNNLMPFITQVAVGRRERLNVFGGDYDTPDGSCVRDYIHVVDLALGHAAAIDYTVHHTGTEIFNLGTGTGYSVLEMVRTFREANGVPLPYAITARRPGDLPAYYADPSKSAQLLGWTAQRNLQDMCRDAWNWQKNNPMGYGDNAD